MLREAKIEDAAAIQRIYGPYCVQSPITFELEVPSLEELQKRIVDYKRYGYYVYEKNSEVVAYAYASKHRERQAYQWCCEVSIYTDTKHQRKGLARELYERLFIELKKKGLKNAYAGITLPNEASVRFHEAMGFEFIGTYKNIGFKAGRWWDVGWWGLSLAQYELNPTKPMIY